MSLTLAIPYFSPKDYTCFTLTIILPCLVGKEKCLRNFILWGAIKKNINNVYILLYVLAADGGILKLLCKYHQHPNSSAKSSDGNKGSLNLPPKTQGKPLGLTNHSIFTHGNQLKSVEVFLTNASGNRQV